MKREWKRRALPTRRVENDSHNNHGEPTCNSGRNADNEHTPQRDGEEVIEEEEAAPTPVGMSAISSSGEEGYRPQSEAIDEPTPTPLQQQQHQHHIEREGPKHGNVEQQRQRNACRKLRTQADVELRLQEAIEREADTLYLTNYSLHQFDSPFLPRVAECLTTLHLNLNHLTEFPLSVLSCYKLECLNLSHNKIAGPVPEGIGQLTALKRLMLSYNRITSFPASISKMSSLTSLHLEGNPTLLYMPAEVMKRIKSESTFMLKWNSAKDSCLLTKEKQAVIERCEPLRVPSLLDLACSSVLAQSKKCSGVLGFVETLPLELQEYLTKTYKCWRCRRKCTGEPPVAIIRRANLAPLQKPQNRRSLGYWGGDPTSTPCLFLFHTIQCYLAWHADEQHSSDTARICKAELKQPTRG